MMSRTILTSNGLPLPRSILSVIGLLTAPRILSTACCRVMPWIGSPSRAVMTSPAQDAGLGGRRIVDGRDDLEDVVLHRDLDAEAAELALGLDLHVLEALGVHVARMRIERGEHAVDGRFDQLAVVGLLDIVGAHALEHVAEQVELLVSVGDGCVGAAHQGIAAALPQLSRSRRVRHRRIEWEACELSACLLALIGPPGGGIYGYTVFPELDI